jgi:hypothetical protein
VTLFPGDWLGIMGFGVGIVCFGLTWYQLWKTKSVLLAEERATRDAVQRVNGSYENMLGILVELYFDQLKKYIDDDKRELAKLRSNDLLKLIPMWKSSSETDSVVKDLMVLIDCLGSRLKKIPKQIKEKNEMVLINIENYMNSMRTTVAKGAKS